MKRGSIALARSLCYEIAGPTDEDDDITGSDYGSVDIAEILSAEVERLRAAICATLDANGHLADGEVCTLLALKVALRESGAPWAGDVPPPPTFNDKEINMEHELKHGQALVITGPQGCGKTALARKIAEMNGRFIEANAYELETHRALNALLASEPNTVIYEGFPASEDAQARLKALMASDTMSVRPKFGAPKTVKTPNFIFCSGYADWLPLHDNRRFFVINLGTPA